MGLACSTAPPVRDTATLGEHFLHYQAEKHVFLLAKHTVMLHYHSNFVFREVGWQTAKSCVLRRSRQNLRRCRVPRRAPKGQSCGHRCVCRRRQPRPVVLPQRRVTPVGRERRPSLLACRNPHRLPPAPPTLAFLRPGVAHPHPECSGRHPRSRRRRLGSVPLCPTPQPRSGPVSEPPHPNVGPPCRTLVQRVAPLSRLRLSRHTLHPSLRRRDPPCRPLRLADEWPQRHVALLRPRPHARLSHLAPRSRQRRRIRVQASRRPRHHRRHAQPRRHRPKQLELRYGRCVVCGDKAPIRRLPFCRALRHLPIRRLPTASWPPSPTPRLCRM